MRRTALRLGLIATLVAAGAGLAAAPASAAPACSNQVCLTVAPFVAEDAAERGGTADLDYTIEVSSGAADAVFIARLSAGLTPVATGIMLDGATLPSSAVHVTGGQLVLDLGQVQQGQHDLELTARTSRTATAQQTVAAGVSYHDAATGPTATATAATEKITLRTPDFSVGVPDEPLFPIVAGYPTELQIPVTGDQLVPGVLKLTEPAGFVFYLPTLDDDPKKPLTCGQTGRVLTCTGMFGNVFDVDIKVRAAPTAKAGLTGVLGISLQPQGEPDLTPADNTAELPLAVAGNSALAIAFSPVTKSLYLGQPTTYRVTVTNLGPDPSPNTHAIIGMLANSGDFSISYPADIKASTVTAHSPPATGTWTIGTLAKGQSASTTATITGHKLNAKGAFGITTFTDSINSLSCSDRACLFSKSLRLTTISAPIAKPVAPKPTPTPIQTQAVATPELAATGGPIRLPSTLGLLALLGGVTLTRTARRRC